MRRFLIRRVQVLALAIVGTGFLVDTSFAAMVDKQTCDALGGEWIVDTMSYGASIKNPKISCIYSSPSSGTVTISCYKGECMSSSDCRRGACTDIYSKGYKPPPRRPGTTTVSAGTTADRYGRSPGATTLGAPVNSGLNAVAPSHTAPAVSMGALSNTQAAIGLAGIDKPAGIPPQLSDRLNRMRR
jgi:hypothetical protein